MHKYSAPGRQRPGKLWSLYLIIYNIQQNGRHIPGNIAVFRLCFAILHPCYIVDRLLDPPTKLWYYNQRKEQNALKF